MSGCNRCNSPTLHSCQCQQQLSIWTNPLAMGRTEHKRESNSDCSDCEDTNDCKGTDCKVGWSITPLQTTPKGTVTFVGYNFPPNGNFQVRVTGPQADYWWTVTSDNAGVVNSKLEAGLVAGVYQFTPQITGCVAKPRRNSVSVIACAPIDPSEECDCLGTVTIAPVLIKNQLYSGDKTSLVLTVRNTNSCPAREISVPTLVLPTGLSSTTPINLSNVTVAGNSSVTFTYEVTANNTTASDIQTEIRLMPNTMTYKCGGTTFFAGGGSSHATIKSSVTGNCALAITELSVTPAAVANGGAVTYVMKVKNTGTNAIVNMNLAPVSLSSLLATFTPASTFAISNVNLAVGAEHTITIAGSVTVSPLPAGTQHAHQVLINSGAITGTCNYGVISNQLPKVATLIVNG